VYHLWIWEEPSWRVLATYPTASEAYRQALDKLCEREGVAERFRVRQGCVIEKVDGTRFQVRNFDRSEPWMRAASFQDIRRVYRSPLNAM